MITSRADYKDASEDLKRRYNIRAQYPKGDTLGNLYNVLKTA